MKARILIAEDDVDIRDLMKLYLESEGYEILCSGDGAEALSLIEAYNPQLAILDIMMPSMTGLEVTQVLRKKTMMPILILSAKGQDQDKILGLNMGADDYMEKPFDSKELVARAKAVLRRYKPSNTPTENPNDKCVEYADLTINLTNYSVIYMGHTVEMPPKELELLYFLASSPNHVFTREQLLDQIWGYEYIGDTRTVDVHIKRLREKIKDHANWKISTIWGIGYKFEVRN